MVVNNMINIVICDDERVILQKIRLLVEVFLKSKGVEFQIFTYENPIEMLNEIKSKKIDVLLLDIEFPEISGMEIAEKLNQLGIISLLIFVTSHESHVFESFKYGPYDFIRKRHYEAELTNSLERALATLSEMKKEYLLEQSDCSRSIPLNDIMYFESNANYVRVVLEDKEFLQRKNLQQIETELTRYGFIRIHKGFLVNQKRIHILRADKVVLENGEELPIGRAYKEAAKNKILKYFRG